MRKKSINFDKIFFHRHHYGIMLSVLFLALLVGLAMLYQAYKPPEDKGSAQVARGADQVPEGTIEPPTLQLGSQSIGELCRAYANIENEISCEKAVNLALEKYPGQVYFIGEEGATAPAEGKNNWIVEINLNNRTAESGLSIVDIVVNKNSGKVGVYQG